jgi:hypothetical protein
MDIKFMNSLFEFNQSLTSKFLDAKVNVNFFFSECLFKNNEGLQLKFKPLLKNDIKWLSMLTIDDCGFLNNFNGADALIFLYENSGLSMQHIVYDGNFSLRRGSMINSNFQHVISHLSDNLLINNYSENGGLFSINHRGKIFLTNC